MKDLVNKLQQIRDHSASPMQLSSIAPLCVVFFNVSERVSFVLLLEQINVTRAFITFLSEHQTTNISLKAEVMNSPRPKSHHSHSPPSPPLHNIHTYTDWTCVELRLSGCCNAHWF